MFDRAGLQKSPRVSFNQARTRIISIDEKMTEVLRSGANPELYFKLAVQSGVEVERQQQAAYRYQKLFGKK